MPTFATGTVRYHVSDFLSDRHPYSAHASKANTTQTGRPSHTTEGVAKFSHDSVVLDNLLEVLIHPRNLGKKVALPGASGTTGEENDDNNNNNNEEDIPKQGNPVELVKALRLLQCHSAAAETKIQLLRKGIVSRIVIVMQTCLEHVGSGDIGAFTVSTEKDGVVRGPSGNVVAAKQAANMKPDPTTYSWALVEQLCCQVLRSLCVLSDGCVAVVTQGGWAALIECIKCGEGCASRPCSQTKLKGEADSKPPVNREVARIAAATAVSLLVSNICGRCSVTGGKKEVLQDLHAAVDPQEEESESVANGTALSVEQQEQLLSSFFEAAVCVFDQHSKMFCGGVGKVLYETSCNGVATEIGSENDARNRGAADRSNHLSLVVSLAVAVQQATLNSRALHLALIGGIVRSAGALLEGLLHVASLSVDDEDTREADVGAVGYRSVRPSEESQAAATHNYPGTTPVGHPAPPASGTVLSASTVASTANPPTNKSILRNVTPNPDYYITNNNYSSNNTKATVLERNVGDPLNIVFHKDKHKSGVIDYNADDAPKREARPEGHIVLPSTAQQLQQLQQDEKKQVDIISYLLALLWQVALDDVGKKEVLVELAQSGVFVRVLGNVLRRAVESHSDDPGDGFIYFATKYSVVKEKDLLTLQANAAGAIGGMTLLPDVKKLCLENIPVKEGASTQHNINIAGVAAGEEGADPAFLDEDSFPHNTVLELLLDLLRQANHRHAEVKMRMGTLSSSQTAGEPSTTQAANQRLLGMVDAIITNVVQAVRLIAELPAARTRLHELFSTNGETNTTNTPNIKGNHHRINLAADVNGNQRNIANPNDNKIEVTREGTEHKLRRQLFFSTKWEKEFLVYVY